MGVGLGTSWSTSTQEREVGDASYPVAAMLAASMIEEGEGIDISKDRFDLSTFRGRLAHFYSTTSPLTLLASTSKLLDAQEYVKEVESRFPTNHSSSAGTIFKSFAGQKPKDQGYVVTKEEAQRYWKAKQLVQSSVHPDTYVFGLKAEDSGG